MCECCVPKEHLGHIHLGGEVARELEKVNEVLAGVPGVFRAVPADHGPSGGAIVFYDRRITTPEQVREALRARGFQV